MGINRPERKLLRAEVDNHFIRVALLFSDFGPRQPAYTPTRSICVDLHFSELCFSPKRVLR